jgi:hypothetical protein
MEAPPSADLERRCPTCGALVSVDAEWCGQCFEPLGASRAAPPEPPPPEVAPAPEPPPLAPPPAEPAPDGALQTPPTGGARIPTWPCPTCGTKNGIDLDVCAVCGTSFAALMRSDEQPPPVDPMSALRRSLIFPGLGHRMVGHTVDGFARGALFLILAGMTLLAILTGAPTATLVAVLVLFATMTLVVYLGSAWEAHRIADGEQPFVSARVLLWAAVGAIMLSVALLAFAVASAARR